MLSAAVVTFLQVLLGESQGTNFLGKSFLSGSCEAINYINVLSETVSHKTSAVFLE